MNKIKEFFSDWSRGEIIWLIFVLVVQTLAWWYQKEDFFMWVLTISMSLNLVLGAKGKIAGLYFAIINSILYAIQCYGLHLYGEVMYHVLYSIPVSAIAIFQWKKNMSSSGEVEFRNMDKTMMLLCTLGTAVAAVLYKQLLTYLGGNLAWMDSLTTIVGVVASMLYLFRYSEQWGMWVVVNVLEIIMWFMVLSQGDKSGVLIILMDLISLINCIYGLINWRNIANKYGNNPAENLA